MPLWTVTFEHPVRAPRRYSFDHLAPTFELVVDRIGGQRASFGDWRELPGPDRSIFVESYSLTRLDPETGEAWATFKGMRRNVELRRHFDPRRLP